MKDIAILISCIVLWIIHLFRLYDWNVIKYVDEEQLKKRNE